MQINCSEGELVGVFKANEKRTSRENRLVEW